MDGQQYVVTLDTDWVPQFMLDSVLDMLEAYAVPATIFCTSPYEIVESDRVEIGLHPNMMSDSTQGKSEQERLGYVSTLYPHAAGLRTHRYYWHGGMYSMLEKSGLKYDSSILLPFQQHLKPSQCFGITRFPVWCGDNLYMRLNPETSLFRPPGFDGPGLKVFNFHPVHIWLNSRSVEETSRLLGGRSLPALTTAQAMHLRRSGNGMEKVFSDVLSILSGKDNLYTLRELL